MICNKSINVANKEKGGIEWGMKIRNIKWII